MEEPIGVSEKQGGEGDHKFEVKDDGRVEFQAEIVYFKFDDHTLTEQGMSRLNALAKYLSENPKSKLVINGHCDERGAPEYNLALGQLRSESVQRYLATLGVQDNRMETISYGEEQPAENGTGEIVWAKNRRAEFALTSFEE